MPFYDFICLDCHTGFEKVFRYSDYGKQPVVCPVCRSDNHRRKINRVRYARSEESRINSLDSMGNIQNLADLDDDPQAMGRMMRKMSSELGEDLGDEFKEVVHRLEKGHDPQEIEEDLPDLGGKDLPPASLDMAD